MNTTMLRRITNARRGGARPGAGRPSQDKTRKSAGTRLTDDERARIEAWGERHGLGFSEALREAALMTVDSAHRVTTGGDR